MRLEHLAFNIADAPAMATWYVQHLGMPMVRESHNPNYCAFLGEGQCLLEIYCNPAHPFWDPQRLDPITLHVALLSLDLRADINRLVGAGATLLSGEPDAQGYGLIFLRCPWGLPLQLCRRLQPLIPTE